MKEFIDPGLNINSYSPILYLFYSNLY